MARKNCKNGRKTTFFKNVILLDAIFATDKETTHYKQQELFSKGLAVNRLENYRPRNYDGLVPNSQRPLRLEQQNLDS
eukprot:scaffold128673_cov29-Attheya_sp.AAC.3